MAALLAVLVGCNKELQQDTPADVDGKVYMQFSVNMLTLFALVLVIATRLQNEGTQSRRKC